MNAVVEKKESIRTLLDELQKKYERKAADAGSQTPFTDAVVAMAATCRNLLETFFTALPENDREFIIRHILSK